MKNGQSSIIDNQIGIFISTPFLPDNGPSIIVELLEEQGISVE